MATIPDAGPIWWDRDADDQGRPIRADVRQAAHQLWPEAVKRVRRTLSDPAEASELMEISVVQISHHLDHTNMPLFASKIPSLLSLHFSQELKRLAKKLGRIKLVGDKANIEQYAVVECWAEQIDRRLDFKKVIARLKATSRTIVAMRLEEHNWNLIGAKMGDSPASLRRSFWKDLREVLSRMMGRCNGTGEGGHKK
jgi:hypothetical protein